MSKIVKLSEMFGVDSSFIEEEFAIGNPTFTFYDKPQPIVESSTSILSGVKGLGIAEGVFAVLDGVSRNGRLYPADFWRHVISDPMIQARVKARDMLGTIGHHDKIVDNDDLAKGVVSHVITELRIDESTKTVIGRLEILDTPAGRLLQSYYQHNLPMYVSSRGAGKLIKRMGEPLDVVDENHYFLQCWDIVKDPGFLQAKPDYKNVVEEKLNSIEEELIKIPQGEDHPLKDILDEDTDLVVVSDSGKTGINRAEIIEDNETEEEDIMLKLDGNVEELIKSILSPMQEDFKLVQESIKSIQETVVKIVEDKEIEKVTQLQEEKQKIDEQVKELSEKLVQLQEESAKKEEEDKKEKEEKDAKIQEMAEEKAKIEEAKEALIKESESLLEMVKTHVEECKKVQEEKGAISEEIASEKVLHEETRKQLEEAVQELNARKLAEEVGISIEEAKERLQTKSIEEAKADVEKEKEEKEKEDAAKALEEELKKVNESKTPVIVDWIKQPIVESKEKNLSERPTWIH